MPCRCWNYFEIFKFWSSKCVKCNMCRKDQELLMLNLCSCMFLSLFWLMSTVKIYPPSNVLNEWEWMKWKMACGPSLLLSPAAEVISLWCWFLTFFPLSENCSFCNLHIALIAISEWPLTVWGLSTNHVCDCIQPLAGKRFRKKTNFSPVLLFVLTLPRYLLPVLHITPLVKSLSPCWKPSHCSLLSGQATTSCHVYIASQIQKSYATVLRDVNMRIILFVYGWTCSCCKL